MDVAPGERLFEPVALPEEGLVRVRLHSYIPGRARYRTAPCRPDGWVAGVEHRASTVDGVSQVRCNRRTGSILVRFDPARLSVDQVTAGLGLAAGDAGDAGKAVGDAGNDAAAARGPDASATSPADDSRPPLDWLRRARWRPGHPVVLAGSLLLSLGGLVTGRMGLHLGAGLFFLGGVVDHTLRGRRRRPREGGREPGADASRCGEGAPGPAPPAPPMESM